MSHFAKIENGIVTNVLVAEQDVIDTIPGKWVQTSYNTKGGVHYLPDSTTPSGQPALRGNYAGIGYTYNETLDAFIPPIGYASWVLNTTTYQWEPPVPYPEDTEYAYNWDESTISWFKGEKIISPTTNIVYDNPPTSVESV